MKDLRKTELGKEASHLLLLLSSLSELLLKNSGKLLLKLILKGAYLRRYEVAKFVFDGGSGVDLISLSLKIDEVLRIWLWELGGWDLRLIVDRLVLLDRLGKKSLSSIHLGIEVSLVRSTTSFSKWLGLSVLLDSQGQIGNGHIHATTLITSLVILRLTKLPPALGIKVFGVIGENISELPILEIAQVIIGLVLFVSLLEVDGDLSSNFGENICVHTSVTCLLEEEILSLSETEVAVH